MDFLFKDFSWEYFSFESYAMLGFALICILFLLFEYFPGRNYFYSLNLLKKFIDKPLIPHLLQGDESKKNSWLRIVAVSFIWVLLVLALANPRWDFEDVEAFRPNVNLVILLDISKSMDAADEKPSRLERAKQEIVDIIKKSGAVNIGIIVFANQSHIISPVTDDRNALMYLLPSVTTDLVGVQGSNITAGLKASDLLLKSLDGGMNYILVMSDGGFEDDDLKSLKTSIKNGKIISFGIGKTDGAPIPDAAGKFIEENDKIVLTRLEKENLIKLSGLENYIQGSYMDDDTQKVISIISSKLDVAEQKAKLQRIWHDRFYIPLMIALILILPFFRRGAMFPVILLFCFAAPVLAQDDEPEPSQAAEKTAAEISTWQKIMNSMFRNDDQQAEILFDEGQYKAAEEKYSANYNKGISAFRSGDHKTAENYFSTEAATSIDSEYNLGNTQLLQNKIKESIATYESVLKKDPQHEDAKINLEIAKKLLQQDKKQNKDKDQDENQQGNGQDKNDLNNSEGQNGNGGDKNNKDQQNSNDKDKNGDAKDNPESGDKEDEKDNSAPGKGYEQNGKEPQETGGNLKKKELDIQAKSILSKISSDPEKLLKGRFKYEEGKGAESSTNNKNPRPW